MDKMNKNKHDRFIILDGMRGIAAIAVMIFHYTRHCNYQTFSNAPMAVDFFFMLSGFVLSYSYGEKVLKNEIGFSDFLCRRIIRLYPMFIVGLLWGSADLYLFHKFGQSTYSLHEIVAALFYNGFFLPFMNTGIVHLFERPFPSTGTIFPANGPSWSLFCEMFINLFFFRLIFMNRKYLVRIIWVSLFLLVSLSFTINLSEYSYTLSVDTGWKTINMLPGLARVFFGFTLGIFVQKSVSTMGTEDVSRLFGGRRIFFFCANYPLLLYALLIAVFSIPFSFYGLTSLLSVTLFCPALLYIGIFTETKSKFISTSSKLLGWISYPIYCLHIPIGNLIAFAQNEGGLYKYLPVSFTISAGVTTIIVSITLARFYEGWLSKHLMSITKSWKLPGKGMAQNGR